MKNFNLIALFFLISIPSLVKAQDVIIVNDININTTKDVHYISIELKDAWRGRLELLIDYGQAKSYYKKRIAEDKKGKTLKFNSKIHAFNVLGNNGWVYVDHNCSSDSTSQTIEYLFKKI